MSSPKGPYYIKHPSLVEIGHPESHRRHGSLLKSPQTKRDAERAFEKRVENLQARSRTRFRHQWDAILDKYSQIDDEKESDELDLSTGEIITDNGHLRSLSHHNSSESGITNIWDPNLELESTKLKGTYASPRKPTYVSPARRPKSLDIRDIDLQDNVLLLSPSPKKSKRTSMSSSPSSYLPESPSKDTPKRRNERDTTSIRYSPTKDSNTPVRKLFSNASSNTTNDPFMEGTCHVKCDFAAPTKLSIYHCAIESCDFCTGNRSEYRKHLIETHRSELIHIGYPLNPSASPRTDYTQDCDDIKKVFPLFFDTILTEPLRCNSKISSLARCRRMFFSLADLNRHLMSSDCDPRTPIYTCPILGCSFQTEHFEGLRDHFKNYTSKASHLSPSAHDKVRKSSLAHRTTHPALSKKEVADEIDQLFDSD